jgi:hypothetical protein
LLSRKQPQRLLPLLSPAGEQAAGGAYGALSAALADPSQGPKAATVVAGLLEHQQISVEGLAACGALQSVVRMLDAASSHDTVLRALGCLHAAAKHDAAAVLATGALPPLLSCLSGRTDRISGASSELLAVLAPALQQAAGQQKAAAAAVAPLGSLLRGSKVLATRAAAAGALEALHDAGVASIPAALAPAAKALVDLADAQQLSPGQRITALQLTALALRSGGGSALGTGVKAGAARAAVAMLQAKGEPLLLQLQCKALAELAAADAECARAAAAAGAVRPLVRLLGRGRDIALRSWAAQALCELGRAGQRAAAIKEGAVPLLVDLLAQYNSPPAAPGEVPGLPAHLAALPAAQGLDPQEFITDLRISARSSRPCCGCCLPVAGAWPAVCTEAPCPPCGAG